MHDLTESPGAQDQEVHEGKLFAAVGYLSVFCFVPLFLKRQNRFAQFHGKQAVVLFVLEISAVIFGVIPALGDLISTVALVLFSILSLTGIVKVLLGEYWEMPVIHDISSRVRL